MQLKRSAHHRSLQRGVALATALIVLVVLTLLGIAAMRSSKLAQRLAGTSQSRMSAMQQAQSMADAIKGNDSKNLPILPGSGYFYCYLNSSSALQPGNAPAPYFGTVASGSINSSPSCANYTLNGTAYVYNGALTLAILGSTTNLPNGDVNPLNLYTYGQAIRLAAADGSDFVTTATLRDEETSGRAYDFASFLVMGGYDNGGASLSASTVGQGVAEVNEGVYKRHAKATGVSNQ